MITMKKKSSNGVKNRISVYNYHKIFRDMRAEACRFYDEDAQTISDEAYFSGQVAMLDRIKKEMKNSLIWELLHGFLYKDEVALFNDVVTEQRKLIVSMADNNFYPLEVGSYFDGMIEAADEIKKEIRKYFRRGE